MLKSQPYLAGLHPPQPHGSGPQVELQLEHVIFLVYKRIAKK